MNMMHYQTITAGAIALALLAGGVAASTVEDVKVATHDGTVVSISSTELVMKSKDEKEHTHTLAKDATMTLDGKECKAAELKAGMKIRVTTAANDTKVARHIEAISKHANFAHTHDGTVISSTSSKLIMMGQDGKEHSHTVANDTKVTCDGKVCKATDLKPRMKIRVTTKKTDEGAAIMIEAIDKNGDFA
jgi:hypothetical protein